MRTVPYPHQLRALEAMADKPAYALFMDPGTGKSKVILDDVETREGLRALVVVAPNGVHRKWIAHECPTHMSRPHRAHGVESGWDRGRYAALYRGIAAGDDHLHVLAVGFGAFSRNTLAARFLNAVVDNFPTMVVVDECFPSATLVLTASGWRNIDTLTVGTNVITPSGVFPVKHLYLKRSQQLVFVETEIGGVYCTPNHPFFTNNGWVTAKNLAGMCLYDERNVRLLRDGVPPRLHLHAEVLQRILRSEAASSRRGDRLEQGEDVAARASGRAEPFGEGERPDVQGSWWQRAWADRAAALADDDPECCLEAGISHRIGREAAWLSNLLQGRLGLAGEEIGDRGGRGEPQADQEAGAGSEEGGQAHGIRVVRVASVELDRPCDVYDIEIEGDPRFFANGVLVHNSTRIKTYSAQRTKGVARLGEGAAFKRILSGTPVANGIQDLYCQFGFLDGSLYRRGPNAPTAILGCRTYTAFKATYCRMGGFEGRQIVGYQNVDMLRRRIAPYVFEARKEDVLPDLPAKTHERHAVALSREQARHYKSVRDDLLLSLDDGRVVVDLPEAITRLLRLQQIVGGFLPDGQALECPRLDATVERVTADVEEGQQVIVWARFVAEVMELARRIEEAGARTVGYHGGVSNELRAHNLQYFQSGQARVLVGTQAAGGIGLDMTAASRVYFYSNTFGYEDRVQAEDRCHRIGQKNSVTYIDLYATGTIDALLATALKRKRDVAALVRDLGDVREMV